MFKLCTNNEIGCNHERTYNCLSYPVNNNIFYFTGFSLYSFLDIAMLAYNLYIMYTDQNDQSVKVKIYKNTTYFFTNI